MPYLSGAHALLRSMTTIQQTTVKLRCLDNEVTFHWPLGSSSVVVTGSLSHTEPTTYSIEEAHELFWALLDAGAY